LVITFTGCRRDGRLPSEAAPMPKVVPYAIPHPLPNRQHPDRQPPVQGGTVVIVPMEPTTGASTTGAATAAGTTAALPPSSATVQRIVDDDGGNLRLRLETSRSAYRSGDTVTVRAAITNQSTKPFRYFVQPAWGNTRLVITDESGHVVAPTNGPAGYYVISSHYGELPGGQTRVWSWDTGEWTPIAYWGYRGLAPGRYTVAGSPIMWSGRAHPDTTVRSNHVSFTIAP
jgi:hypothetical protein